MSIHDTTPIEKVIHLFEEYELSVIAVINKEEQLQGRIVFEDIYDLICMQEQSQALKMAGADKDAEEESLDSARKARLHWLFINLVATLLLHRRYYLRPQQMQLFFCFFRSG